MTSTGSLALRDRGSYSQPAAPTVAGTNAQGRMAQPKTSKQYSISAPVIQTEPSTFGRPSSTQVPAKFAKVAGFPDAASTQAQAQESKAHKRSNTIGSIFGRSNSIFGGKRNTGHAESGTPDKQKRAYPPVSMSGAMASGQFETPRPSMDSRRSISFGFGKKRSGSISGSQTTLHEKPKRFSLLPASFSLKSIGIGKEYGAPGASPDQYEDRPESHGNYLEPPQTARTDPSRNMSGATATHPYTSDGTYDRRNDSPRQDRRGQGSPAQPRYSSQYPAELRSGQSPQFLPPMHFRHVHGDAATESESSLNDAVQRRGHYAPGFTDTEEGYVNISHRAPPQVHQNRMGGARGVLQKNNRKFTEAYENEQNNGYGPTHSDHAGSSGAARKVMDFFRRRGRDRGQ
jgi:protein-serine/threonine kinase